MQRNEGKAIVRGNRCRRKISTSDALEDMDRNRSDGAAINGI